MRRRYLHGCVGEGGVVTAPRFAPLSIARSVVGALLAATLFALSGCAGAPPVRRDVAQLFGYLPDGQSAYVSVNVRDNQRLFREFLSTQDADGATPKRILAATNTAAAALSFGAYNRPVIYLLADGSFPHRSAALNLTLSRAWKRVGPAHWRHRGDGVEIAFIEPTVFALATEGTGVLADAVASNRFRPIPPELETAVETADMVLYTDSVGADAVGAFADQGALPAIEWLWVALEAPAAAESEEDTPKHYEGVGEVRFESERDARVASVVARLLIVRLARESEADMAAVLKGARVSVRGRTLIVGGLDVPEKTLLEALSRMTARAQEEP